jgi:hypothetical protein
VGDRQRRARSPLPRTTRVGGGRAARYRELSWGLVQEDGGHVGRLAWAWPNEQYSFRIYSNFQTNLILIQSKGGLSRLEKIQIKYGFVGN